MTRREWRIAGRFLWVAFLTLLSGALLLGSYFHDAGPEGLAWLVGLWFSFVVSAAASVVLVGELGSSSGSS